MTRSLGSALIRKGRVRAETIAASIEAFAACVAALRHGELQFAAPFR
jgi:hypothetical protein